MASSNNRTKGGSGGNKSSGAFEGRKTRVKTDVSSSEFIGFSAFASEGTASMSTSSTVFGAASTTPSSPNEVRKAGTTFSPVFSGSDNTLAMLFRKIGQKRDAVTKSKALADLSAFAFPPKGEEEVAVKTEDAGQEAAPSRKDQVAALSHLLFLYGSKLHYDNSPVVRAQCLSAIHAAQWHVPKAWKAALFGESSSNLLGKIWATQFDPAAEVVRSATPLVTTIRNFPGAELAIVEGTCSFASSVLSYGRAQSLHDDLFSSPAAAADQGRASQNKQGGDDGVPADEKEERYERVLLGAMNAITQLLQEYPDGGNVSYPAHISEPILWKHLNSQRGSFRRRTYALLSAICLRAPSLLHPVTNTNHKLSSALPSSLSAEKDPANIPALLEALLLYITSFPTDQPTKSKLQGVRSAWDDGANGMNAEVLVKALGKILKRAGHGSSASEWGPIILPILATIPSDQSRLHAQVLESLWEGRKATGVRKDQIEIVHATAEGAAFLLQRRKQLKSEKIQDGPEEDEDVVQEIVNYFVDPLTHTLRETGPKTRAEKLMVSFAEHLFKLGQDSQRDGVTDYLWQAIAGALCPQQRDLVFTGRLATLVNLLVERFDRAAAKEDEKVNIMNHLLAPVLRDSFLSTLRSSEVVVEREESQLLLHITTLFGADHLFSSLQEHGLLRDGEENWGSLRGFCENYLVVWITAHCSEREPIIAENRCEFAILMHCLASLESKDDRNKIWDFVVRTLVASVPTNLKVLAAGLSSMAAESQKVKRKKVDMLDIYTTLESVSLEGFIKEKGLEYERGDFEGDSSGLSLLIRTSLGLKPGNHPLIGANVVSRWIESACREDGVALWTKNERSVVVLALIDVLSSNRDLVSQAQIVQLVVECWLRGGTVWEQASSFWVSKLHPQDTSILVVQAASAKLQQFLAAPASGDGSSMEHWSDAALRLIRLCSLHDIVQAPYLALTGLNRLDLWESHATTKNTARGSSYRLWECTMSLLRKCRGQEERRTLFWSSSDSRSVSAELFVAMLMLFSDAGGLTHSSDLAMQRSSEFFHLLKQSFVPNFVAELLVQTSKLLARAMQEDSTMLPAVYRGVAVLDMLSGVLFGRFNPNSSSFVPEDAKEGDLVMYTKDGSAGAAQEATIVGIHTDDFPNLYFTVRFQNSKGEQVERQTVSSRIQKKETSEMQVESTEDTATRRRIETLVVNELVKPFFLPVAQKTEPTQNRLEAACRCLSIVISRYGLTGPVGIGSVRYEVFQLVSSLERTTCTSIQNQANEAAFLLRCMAIILGFDRLLSDVGISTSNAAILHFSPAASLAAVVAAYEKGTLFAAHNETDLSNFCRSVLMWIAVSVESSPEDTGKSLMNVVDSVSSKMKEFSTTEGAGVDITVLLLVACLETLMLVTTATDEWHIAVGDSVANVIARVINSFLFRWGGTAGTTSRDVQLDREDYLQPPLWMTPMLSLIRLVGKQSADNVVLGSVPYSNELFNTLSNPSKRWCAYLILVRKLVEQGSADDQGSALPGSTAGRLEAWKQSLNLEEGQELEEDVRAVAKLLPPCLMERIEGWSGEDDNVFDIENEDQVVGRLLSWLLFLEFWDIASDSDVRNRSSLSSYIRKTGACGEIFDICIVYCNDGSLQSSDWQDCLKAKESGDIIDPSTLDLSHLAALALFRTVELLPTVTRSWWTDDCPRGTQAAVTEFIRKHVAPETLRRDLSRIKNATDSLGDMSVSGSLVSREVVATYEQDECQLSVTIRLPPTFPLKNVEVDCKNTLGIAERRWKRWSLLIMRMLNGQDGTILDALQLWKANVDREFDGVEPCPVCYSVLDVKTRSLPNLECKTCGNRFHSACLYKWFQSSGKSQCVLCQQPWSGTKIS